MSKFFCLGYVFVSQEEITIVLGQFIEILADRVVDDITQYIVHTLVAPEPPLREMIMRVMCDPPLTRNFGYLYEYETPQVIWLLCREVFRLHRLHEYIGSDHYRKFSSAV
jgi:hypothetical protein